jgi:cysteine desulfurase family protein (TIGR01976 family)
MARFDSATYRLDPAAVAAVIDERTRLVAVTHASNALGTVVDVAPIVAAAHQVGALVFVDAVHYTPHGLVDVAATGADFLVASAYKFFGPHVGLLYGRGELLEELEAYRVRPAPDRGPGKWETGTQSFAALAGVTAAIDYLASWGRGETRREKIGDAHRLHDVHLRGLMTRFLDGLGPGVTLYGPAQLEGRTPTFALNVGRLAPSLVAARLGEAGIYVWDGHYYALEVMRQLGLQQGAVRVGFVHTTTVEEVDRLLTVLADLEAL